MQCKLYSKIFKPSSKVLFYISLTAILPHELYAAGFWGSCVASLAEFADNFVHIGVGDHLSTSERDYIAAKTDAFVARVSPFSTDYQARKLAERLEEMTPVPYFQSDFPSGRYGQGYYDTSPYPVSSDDSGGNFDSFNNDQLPLSNTNFSSLEEAKLWWSSNQRTSNRDFGRASLATSVDLESIVRRNLKRITFFVKIKNKYQIIVGKLEHFSISGYKITAEDGAVYEPVPAFQIKAYIP